MTVTPSIPRLGLDVFSLRSQGWSAREILNFCAAQRVEVVHFSEPRLLGSIERDSLLAIRSHADALGIALEVGMLSISPGATIFNAAAGTAEQQLSAAIDLAVLLGSPVVRCAVGSWRDRATPDGIEPRIEEALTTLAAVRSRASDKGVRIAVENHAGDLQAHELKALVNAAGPDLVGVCLDAGNAFWAMDDPHLALEMLAPYVLTSHTRDTAVRATSDGAEVAWTRMGDGNIGIETYLASFQRLCPGRPIMLEIIVMPSPRPLTYRTDEFWNGFRRMPAWAFQRFVNLVDRARPAALPQGDVDAAEERRNVEASLAWTREYLQGH